MMIRNLKVLLAAAMALAAFGAFSASGAQAAEEFHCDPAPGTASCHFKLKPDGTTTTSHHVFVVKNSATPTPESASFTCNELDGSGTAAQTAGSVTLITNLQYTTCKIAGNAVIVHMNGCHYGFTAIGQVTVVCPPGKVIELTGPAGCTVTVGPQGPLAGITYNNQGTTPGGNTEVTVKAKVPGIAVSIHNPVPGCFGQIKAPYTSEYTTGNTLVTAETDVPTPAMTAGWWT